MSGSGQARSDTGSPTANGHLGSRVGFPEGAFEHLAELEDDHFWFQSRNRLIVWAIGRHFPGAERLLEVGSGSGVVLAAIREQFPTLELVGVDQSPEALRHAAARVDAELMTIDVCDLPFVEEFDVVCAFDVLEHVDDDAAALARLAAATRPGGGLLLTVPQYEWLWSDGDDYGGHRRRYTKRPLEAKIADAGFTIVRSTAWVFSLLPILAASRLWEKRRKGRYDPQRELKPPRPVNRAFEAILDAERFSIERGIDLPFGSSRLVVAEKR